MKTELWQRRLCRAEHLEALWPCAAAPLRFFRAITTLQRQVHQALSGVVAPQLEALLPFVAPLLSLVRREGPGPLAEEATRRQGWPEAAWAALLAARWTGASGDDEGSPDWLFSQALLQPYAMLITAEGAAAATGCCPRCGRPPLVSVLSEERSSDGRVRTLLCSLCGAQWRFPRAVCPACGQQQPGRLPRFCIEEVPWMGVEGCEDCGCYIKSVDLSREPDADPVADELGALPLDVFAAEQGFHKLALNLAGL
ncbi:MAG: formate dehydrogenase accessory protein FdhE [Myxococcales bacterium]|nr:formate dehydrogenase accessory protein FdhE [Myxococcota bacterium]MDW8283325.1 formate dehydrogenase accessory protein FdhE [Myxococcales bacterium]